MTFATVQLCETNGAGVTVTHDITNCVYGSSDAVNLSAASATINIGSNSFEKFWRIELDALGTATSIDDMKMWRVGSLGTNMTHEVDFSTTYSTPSATAMTGGAAFPTAEPLAANIEVGGVAGGSISVAGNHSDYVKSQVKTTTPTAGDAPVWYICVAWFEA